ncbi:hypothetical protein HZ326_13525 [Fusarium oxysporum f. sp. albedinis]|nr:hypothetical protein HZ326_13525 [Fusarium oxysporum f. sp. albedinis]
MRGVPIFGSFSSDLAFLSLFDHRSRLFACRSRSSALSWLSHFNHGQLAFAATFALSSRKVLKRRQQT